jgi:hypothetical protein
MYIGLRIRYLLFLSEFNETWILSADFRKIFKFQISLKSRRWDPRCCMRTNRHNKAEILFAVLLTRLQNAETYRFCNSLYFLNTGTRLCQLEIWFPHLLLILKWVLWSASVLCHILPSVYRCLTFSVCYADRIFAISECCRDSFGEIVCSAVVTLVCIRYALVRFVAAYRRFSSR